MVQVEEIVINSQDAYALGRTLEALVLMGESLVDVTSRLEWIMHSTGLASVPNPVIQFGFRASGGADPRGHIWVAVTLAYKDSEFNVSFMMVTRSLGRTSAEFRQINDKMEVEKFWGVCRYCDFRREDIPHINVQWLCSNCGRFNS